MNNNEIKGRIKQATGAAKAAIGEITGQPSVTLKGKAEKLIGKGQQKLGEAQRETAATQTRTPRYETVED